MCTRNWDAGYQNLLDLTQMPTLENLYLSLKIFHSLYIKCSSQYFPEDVFVPQASRYNHFTLCCINILLRLTLLKIEVSRGPVTGHCSQS